MKKLSVDLASVTKQNYLKGLGWINKLIRLWGTVTVNGEELLLPRRFFYSNANASWCRSSTELIPLYCTDDIGNYILDDSGNKVRCMGGVDGCEPLFVVNPCKPEFTKEEAKAKDQTWYPTYFAPYYTKKDASGNYSTDENDLGMEVFRFLNADKDLAEQEWDAGAVRYAWFQFNVHKLAELNSESVTALLNKAVHDEAVNGKLTLELMVDLNGDLLNRNPLDSCTFVDESLVCSEQKIDAIEPYKEYKESTDKDLNKLYKAYEKWFTDNWDKIISGTLVDCSYSVPYIRPIGMLAFYEPSRLKVIDVKRIPVKISRAKTYTDAVSGFYETVSDIRNTLIVKFELSTYQLDQSSEGIYTHIITATKNKNALMSGAWATNNLIRQYIASDYIPEDSTEATRLEYIKLNNKKTTVDPDMWMYSPKHNRYALRVHWLRTGLMGDGSVVKISKRIKLMQGMLDFDYKKQKHAFNPLMIIMVVTLVVIAFFCEGCTGELIASMIAAEVGVSVAVATAVAFTIVLSTALNLIAFVASMFGMYQMAMDIQIFLKTIQPIVILATIIYAYAAIAQRFAAERAADAAMQATEKQVASMGGSTFEFVPRTNIEIAVDLVKDSVSSTINNFTSSITNFSDFSSMTYDKAIKMIDTSTKVAMQIYENYAKTEMKKLSDEMKSIQQENAELAEATEKSELSINLLIATQNAAFNNLTNDMSKDVSMFDTPYMPAIRLGHIGNTQTTSAIALMGEAGDNYMNRYY